MTRHALPEAAAIKIAGTVAPRAKEASPRPRPPRCATRGERARDRNSRTGAFFLSVWHLLLKSRFESVVGSPLSSEPAPRLVKGCGNFTSVPLFLSATLHDRTDQSTHPCLLKENHARERRCSPSHETGNNSHRPSVEQDTRRRIRLASGGSAMRPAPEIIRPSVAALC